MLYAYFVAKVSKPLSQQCHFDLWHSYFLIFLLLSLVFYMYKVVLEVTR